MNVSVDIGMVTAGDEVVASGVVQRLREAGAARPFGSLDEARAAGCGFILARSRKGLELCGSGDAPGSGLRAAFESIDPRSGHSRRQAVGRALGRSAQRIVDATAGLGYDSVRLACMGFDVLAIERSPVLAELLADGLQRLAARPQWRDAIARLELRIGDARQMLPELDPPPDAVYIDPMYPPKRKASALPPKRVRIIRELVGDDPDAGRLLDTARAASRRVVVKRPPHAPPLAEGVAHNIETKLVRYDVYCS